MIRRVQLPLIAGASLILAKHQNNKSSDKRKPIISRFSWEGVAQAVIGSRYLQASSGIRRHIQIFIDVSHTLTK